MSDVELLHEAAKAMRERASAVYPPQLDWTKLVMAHSGTALDHARSWPPAVALAVADWLDGEAELVEMFFKSASSSWAEAVARAFLGRDER